MNKHLEKAEKYLQKGKLEAALEEYLQAWKDEPANDAIVFTVADLYQTMKRSKESLECFNFLFEKAMERNDGQKGAELLRKMQVAGPVEGAKLNRVGQLLEKQRPDQAAEQYRRAIDQAGETNPQVKLDSLQGLFRIQPGSLELARRVAEAAAKLGKRDLARDTYQKIADQMSKIGKWAETITALEQVVRYDPGNVTAQIALATAYLKNKQPKSVLSLWKGEEEQTENPEVGRLLAEAFAMDEQPERAEALHWRMAEKDPAANAALFDIARSYLERNDLAALDALLKRVEGSVTHGGSSKGMVSLVEKLAPLAYHNFAVLESLTRVMDRLNLDTPLAAALVHLIGLYFERKDYRAAAEKLENLVAIDPYNPESTAVLQRLRGHIDEGKFQALSNRLGFTPATADPLASLSPEAGAMPALPATGTMTMQPKAEGGGALKDLMLQAEIFLQYGMQEKARERLERIAGAFPQEEERNEELRTLYEKGGFRVARAAQPAASAAASPAGPAAENRDLRADLKKVSEISRNLSRQGTIKAVISTAVNDIGRFLQVSRCVVGLATPNRPPSMVMEYISPGVMASDGASLGRLVMGIQQAIAGKNFPLVAENVTESPMLAGLQDALKSLRVDSLVALPLRDGDQDNGILVLQQCGQRRAFRGNDLAALEALAEQIVMAVANVRLRNLMKALAVTDERSGLLHRDSYLTCLAAEAERMRTQKSPLTVALLQFSDGDGKAADDKAMEGFMNRYSGAVMQYLRQNDVAVKYTSRTLALILPGATSKDSGTVMEKMRKLCINTAAGSGVAPPQIAAGFAEAIREGAMDNTDRITELINRLEWALDEAAKTGGSGVQVLAPPQLQ